MTNISSRQQNRSPTGHKRQAPLRLMSADIERPAHLPGQRPPPLLEMIVDEQTPPVSQLSPVRSSLSRRLKELDTRGASGSTSTLRRVVAEQRMAGPARRDRSARDGSQAVMHKQEHTVDHTVLPTCQDEEFPELAKASVDGLRRRSSRGRRACFR